jgi:hypothetical protein
VIARGFIYLTVSIEPRTSTVNSGELVKIVNPVPFSQTGLITIGLANLANQVRLYSVLGGGRE